MKNKSWFVADEGDNMYNIFNDADFDEDGYYADHNGEDGYHISDFDIVFRARTFADCERWIETNS